MIHIYTSCRNVRPNLKLFNRYERTRLSLGKINRYSKNNDDKSVPEDKQLKNIKADSKKSSNDTKKDYPEEPTTCCMSGCANCVWLEYAEKLSEYYKDGGEKAIQEINEKVTDPNIKAFLLHELRMRNIK